jgi:hypothetical protein
MKQPIKITRRSGSSIFAAMHRSLTLNRKGGRIMKKPILQSSSLFLLLTVPLMVVFMVAGCEKIAPVNTQQSANRSFNLQGTWQLEKVEGGFFIGQYNGEIIWHVNQNQIAVTITDSVYYPILPPDNMGLYSYMLTNDTLTLFNNDNGMTEIYQINLSPDSLILSGDLSACGTKCQFVKIKSESFNN